MKVKTSKGFTLTELLIVMAIVVVLAAVAVPTFTKQLETSRETNDMEVIRNAYTEALSAAVQDGTDGTLDGKIGSDTATQLTPNWGAVTGGSGGVYTVTLKHMQGAKFKQNGTFTAAKPTQGTTAGNAASVTGSEWSYVTPLLMGKKVPAVCAGVDELYFKFEIDADGEVAIKASTVGSDTNCLFAFKAMPTG